MKKKQKLLENQRQAFEDTSIYASLEASEWMNPAIRQALEEKLTAAQMDELNKCYWDNQRGKQILIDATKKYLKKNKK